MLTGRKILVLETDPMAAFPLGAALRKNGWIVIPAQDAAMAMSVARQQKPDAALLNSRLAGGGGLTALKRLRSSIYTTLIPIICIVASGTREKEALVEAGAQETVDPPGDPQEIDAALRRHLERGEGVVQVPAAVLREPERVKALKESKLLDTPPDPELDRISQLAARIADTPQARLSIVDTDRQFFKSQVDFSPTPVTLRETPLSNSICQWVVGGEEELVVGDAREHPVLRSNLAVRDDGVVAYAGIPFSIDGHQILGSFCVVDSKPHGWSEAQVASLRDLGLVLRAAVIMRSETEEPPAKLRAVASALAGATNVLLRDEVLHGDAERLELWHVIEELSGRLVQLAQMTQTAAAS